MREKRNCGTKAQLRDEKAFFNLVEKSLHRKGFEVIETLPRRNHHQEGQFGFKNY